MTDEAFDLAEQLFRERFGERDYPAALELAMEARSKFPDRRSDASYLVALAYNRTGQPDQAFGTLESAMEQGSFWHPELLIRSPTFADLQAHPRMQALIAACQRWMDGLPQSPPPPIVLAPDGANPRAFMVVLHGAASTAELTAPHWNAATKLGLAVIVARSSQPRTEDRWWWGGDNPASRARAAKDVLHAINRQKAPERAPDTRFIVSGFSQGGGIAIFLALTQQPIPTMGYIGVASVAYGDPLGSKSPGGSAAAAIGYLIVGAEDPEVQDVRDLHAFLKANQFRCGLDVVPGLGHAYPQDFGARLTAAIEFVLS